MWQFSKNTKTVSNNSPSSAPAAGSPPPGGGNKKDDKKNEGNKIDIKAKAGDLIKATLKKSSSYASEYAGKTYGEIVKLSKEGVKKAQQMKKLIEQSQRLGEKTGLKGGRN